LPKLSIVLAAALLAAANPAWGGAPPSVVNPDLFNSDQNVLVDPPVDQPPGLVTTIDFSSAQGDSDDPEDAFGNGDGDIEPNTFIFGEGATADNGNEILGDGGETVDFLEWTTSSPVEIRGYHLQLTQQDPFDRTAQLILFRVDGVEQDSFDNDGATGVDNSTLLEISRPFAAPITGSTFRIELTRTTNGPRITEIDALTESFCGNTTVEGPEQCDDGNQTAGDGCDAMCQLEPGCPPAVDPTCVAAAKASLAVKENKPGKEKLTAKLQAFGVATTQADFGNPATGSTRYDLCIYDPEEALAVGLAVNEAGETCGAKQKPCWKAKGTKGWAYKDPEADASGVRSISATSGAAGKGKLQVQAGNNEAKGQDEMPVGIAAMLQSASSATVQVRTSDGLCYGALLSTIKTADGVQFQGKAP
jgi:cysteine-rich repeat protein